MKRSHALMLRKMIKKASASLDDGDALNAVELFPAWAVGVDYAVDARVRDDMELFKCIQPHTSQADWRPSITPALWQKVEKPGQGDTPDNPIPYNNNMALVLNKYYSQYDTVYRCFRDTINPVYADLSALVGIYVEVWEPNSQA